MRYHALAYRQEILPDNLSDHNLSKRVEEAARSLRRAMGYRKHADDYAKMADDAVAFEMEMRGKR